MKHDKTASVLRVLAAYALLTVALPFLCGLAMRGWQQPPDSAAPPADSLPPVAPQPDAAPQQVLLWDAATDSLLQLPLQEYLLGAVASELPQSYADEAFKAQIVAIHSYYEYCRANSIFPLEEGAVLQVDTAKREGYLSTEARAALWGEAADANTQRLQALVEQVAGRLVTWQGAPADTCYHAVSAGATAAAVDVWGEALPYLTSVDSHWDTEAPGYTQTLTFTFQQMYDVLAARFVGPDLSGSPQGWFSGFDADAAGYIKQLRVGGALVKGSDLRTHLSLRSTCFTLAVQDGVFVVTTRGYGHGVGMSQYGAGAMANEGSTWQEILAHYYPGTQIA